MPTASLGAALVIIIIIILGHGDNTSGRIPIFRVLSLLLSLDKGTELLPPSSGEPRPRKDGHRGCARVGNNSVQCLSQQHRYVGKRDRSHRVKINGFSPTRCTHLFTHSPTHLAKGRAVQKRMLLRDSHGWTDGRSSVLGCLFDGRDRVIAFSPGPTTFKFCCCCRCC